ncbi:TetR family transcriptional regulator [Paenibacillus pectinilyticus]|uniref:TetR family transcriptional regulator n=1 Tax=Paenibacillus pectinilyticus TaxID=512399 RepID=A0A1C1A750_9BACL|nr:TetR/AcrR family transcriptional regulator [Paenibacillus pectinilyticus]OCT16393.1 TetR family transcriptional regulator [Paenibacillus pectinilyticus]
MSTIERSYHHGDLRETLIRTSLELISEVGLAGFSVARVAKRAGVSSAAPYRHFPDRESLLAAAGIAFLTELTSKMRAATDAAGNDPIYRLASTAGAYVMHAIDQFVGVELFVAMKGTQFTEFQERKREMVDFLLSLVQEAKPHATWTQVVELLEAHLAISQGYSDMYYQGMFSHMKLTTEDIVERATTATRHLIKGWGLL